MKTKKLFILAALVGAGLVLTACGNGDFPSITRTIPGDDGSVQTPYRDYDNGHRIEEITLEEDEKELNLTEETQFQIKASYSPSDAYDPHLYYTSDNPDIAEVDETGLVTMKDNGTANITVSCDQDASATLTILGYTPVTGIEITPHIESETGRVFDIDVKEPYTFGIHYTPENTSQKDVIWSVVDENGDKSNVALISEKGGLTVSAPKGCNVVNYVVATSAYDESLVAREKITIRDDRIYAESVEIKHQGAKVSESTIDLYLNDELHLDAVTVPEVTTAEKVKWISEDETTAVVDANGVVKAVKAPSSTKVYATIDGKTDWVTINTKKVDVTGVTLDTHAKELVRGDTFTLNATVAPDNASIKTVNYSVVGGHEFASVSPEGVVTALKSTYGTEVKIRATSDDNPEKYDECTVVIAADILIDEPSFKIACGGNEYQLTATTDPAGLPVVWSIDNTELATINAATGLLTTNDSDLIGTINVTAKNEAAGAEDTIELKVTRAPKEFEAGKQYLVGNRDFTNPVFDYDNPSWEDAALALEFSEGHSTDPRFEAEWQLLGVNFDPYDLTTGEGDLFKVRSAEWPENIGLNDYEKNKAVWAGDPEGNLSVAMKDQYNIYYQKLSSDMKVTTGNDYWVYMESSFTGNYYIVGNRQFNSGASEGVPGIDTSWNYVPSALKLVKDRDTTYGEQYIGTLTLEEGDEFRIRNENWFDVALGEEYSFIDINAENNFVVNTASTYNFYFKPSLEGNKLYISDIGAPVEPTGMTFLEGTSLSLAEGRSTTLTPVLVPENATYRNIVYSSSNPEVISVDDNGTLTAKKAVGDAKITAYVLGFEAATKAEIIVTAKANEFTWGIAHSPSWSLDPNMDFREIPVPDGSDAMFAYQASANLTKDTEWKVANTNNEWVNNVEGVVGIDLTKSTEGAFYITEGGNVKTLIGDTYTVTLLIWKGAEKDAGGNFFSGVSFFAVGSGQPTPTPTTPKYHYVLNDVAGKDLVVGKDPDDNPQLEALNIEMKAGDKLYFENYAPATPERLTSLALGTDEGTQGCGFTISEGVLTASKAGKFSFYVKLAYGHDEVYIAQGDQPEPEPFAWGVAGSFSGWKMDNEHKFVQQDSPEGTALYTYKLVNYEFAQNDEWKVLNNNNPAEWVNNGQGVGLDTDRSTPDAVGLKDGNILINQAGTYTITLNIYEGAVKDGVNFVSGMQIIVEKQDSPVPPEPPVPGSPVYAYVKGEETINMNYDQSKVEWNATKLEFTKDETISFVNNVNPTAPSPVTVVLGTDQTTVASGFTLNAQSGALVAGKAGTFSFYLKDESGVLTVYVKEDITPVITGYGYVLNDDDPVVLIKGQDDQGNEQWGVHDLNMHKDDTIYFADYSSGAEVLIPVTIGGTVEEAHDFTALNGVLTCGRSNVFSFFVKLDMGNDKVYIAEKAPEYAYVINTGEPVKLTTGKDPEGHPQLEAIKVSLNAGDTIFFENIVPDPAQPLTSLKFGDEEQKHGFTISNGCLTCGTTGVYNFYVKLAYDNDVVYIAEYVEPTPVTLYLNGGGDSLWNKDGAYFSVYNIDTESFTKMTLVSGNIYKAILDNAPRAFIMVRHDGASDTPSWDNKWNQTDDITFDKDKDYVTITGWGQGDFTYTKYSA